MTLSPLKVVNPFDQQTVCELPYDTDQEIETKLASALEAFVRWRQLSLDQRSDVVRQGLARFREDAELTARDVSLQMGKPINQARGEVATLLERVEQSLIDAPAALAADMLPEKPGFVRRIEHDPLGIVLNIAAWNYPLIIPINVIVPALLAGNVVLLKHSAKTPLTGQALQHAWGRLDVPNLVTNLTLTHEQTARLIGDSRVKHVAFTGSVEGGRQVHQSAARRPIDAGLELGGKDPAYVAADADLPFAVENLVDGACYNAGQSCCAIERVYVHETLYDAFLEGAAKQLAMYQLGDPLDEQTTLGPLADKQAPTKLTAQVQEATMRGARLLSGGKPVAESSGNFFQPTLLADVSNDADVMQEESFGPLLPVAAVPGDQQALQRMNDSRFGLTASVWTGDSERAEWMARQLQAGTIFQNRCDYLDPMLPWTGYGDSGKGSTLSRYGFYHLTRRKSIHFRRTT